MNHAATKGILVIGGTGSVGQLVVALLGELGMSPRVITRDASRAMRLLSSDVEIISGDLNDAASLDQAVNSIEAVVMTHGSP